MEIGATLHQVQLLSEDPARCAEFYGKVYGMHVRLVDGEWLCLAPERRLAFRRGPSNQLGYAAYAFANSDLLQAYRERVRGRTAVEAADLSTFGQGAFKVSDPDGNVLQFGVVQDSTSEVQTSDPSVPPARLQHIAVRSLDPSALVPFYRDVLGFTVSDRVFTESGDMRACFLRSDLEHHALALFHAAEARHDHLSFETTDALQLRDWADRVSRFRERIVWGIGRHGPGNDVFFMIRDPDGNLAEISAEMEVCGGTRLEGRWAHEERTLNLWGGAIMRS